MILLLLLLLLVLAFPTLCQPTPAQVVRVSSNLGWSFELAIRPASDVALHDKYNITGFLQDNWWADLCTWEAVERHRERGVGVIW